LYSREFNYNRNENGRPPWTTLKEQHRMAPVIREIVSSVTYNDTLTDASNVLEREVNTSDDIYTEFPELKKTPILFFNHKEPETFVS
jgi:hypothetical protein